MSSVSNHHPEVIAELNGEPTEADWLDFARWSATLDGSPGVVSVGGIGYATVPVRDAGRLVGYRVVHPSGRHHDIDTSDDPWTCSCGDYVFRRAGVDPLGCKHVRALAAALRPQPEGRP